MTRKPNFLIIMVDQLSGAFFKRGPAPFIHAPVLSSLAEKAVCFENAYCASPLCAPARAAFMYTTLPSKNGVYDNAAEFPSSMPTFVHALRSSGYKTILSGKMHFIGADQLHGFEERLTTDIYPADFGWTPDWRKPDERVDWWYHNLGSVTGAGIAATSNQLEFDDEVCYHAKLRLHQLARDDQSPPFCMMVSFTHPHDPYVTRQKYWDLYTDEQIPEIAVPAIPWSEQDPHSKRLLRAVDHEKFELTERQIKNARRAYFSNVSYLDERIGEILATLRECRFDDNTVIVFCADHGDMLGERGLWYKMNFFEHSMRVPLMIHAPDRFSARAVNEPVSIMDIGPTLYELAGGTGFPLRSDGRSIAELAAGGASLQRSIFAEYVAEGSIDPMLMIRDGRWKFNYCEADRPQLFDLEQDPNETTNVAADPAHADTVAALTASVRVRWDVAGLRQDVLQSQADRLLAFDALRKGSYADWDFQPMQDASQRYMRNHLDLNVVEAGNRFPKGPT